MLLSAEQEREIKRGVILQMKREGTFDIMRKQILSRLEEDGVVEEAKKGARIMVDNLMNTFPDTFTKEQIIENIKSTLICRKGNMLDSIRAEVYKDSVRELCEKDVLRKVRERLGLHSEEEEREAQHVNNTTANTGAEEHESSDVEIMD